MDQTHLVTRLLRYFRDLAPDPFLELTPSTRLLEDWFLDSIGILETVLFLESEFGVAMQRADITAATFASVDALSAFVVARARP